MHEGIRFATVGSENNVTDRLSGNTDLVVDRYCFFGNEERGAGVSGGRQLGQALMQVREGWSFTRYHEPAVRRVAVSVLCGV